MRSNSILLAAALAVAALAPTFAAGAEKKPAAKAATKPAAASGAHAIGKFDDWTAAVNTEGGQTVCYAFTRASASNPAIKGRGDVVLTVTERPGGRDAVAIAAGFAFTPNATVQVVADTTAMDFYTSTRSAFARDGRAAVAAFAKSRTLAAKSVAPKGGPVADQFSLRGFAAAYAAIQKACPAPKQQPA